MILSQIFSPRVRGFRIVEVAMLCVLLTLMLVVYLAKTLGGTERADIAQIERDIGEERQRVRLLQAEVAYLEKPERLERLARTYLGMEPVKADHEAKVETLTEIALREAPRTVVAPPPAEAPQ